jgi:hypothetical protein
MNRPTIPIFKLLPGRPNKTFFSGAAAFFGGILFFTKDGGEVENPFLQTTSTIRGGGDGGRRERAGKSPHRQTIIEENWNQPANALYNRRNLKRSLK